jgi:signal transduction histidine kinase
MALDEIEHELRSTSRYSRMLHGWTTQVAGVVCSEPGDESSSDIEKFAANVQGLVFRLRMDSTGEFAYSYVSESVWHLYELDPADVLRDSSLISGRIHPDDVAEAKEELLRSAAGRSALRQTYRVVLPIRGERVLSVRATPERERNSSIVWHGIVTDVTQERRQAERVNALTLRCEAAVKAVEERTWAVARVSHELRTPLNALMGFAELIRRNPGADPREIIESAQQICRAGKHLLSVVDELQNTACIEAAGSSAALRPLQLADLVEECVRLMTPYAARRRVSLTASIVPSLPAAIADPRAVRQILFNLIGNAVKFSGAESFVRVDAYPKPGSDWIVVSVKDNGPGVPSNDFEKLFKPFSRASGARNGQEGSGLGLAISRQLAVAMGGEIDVASRVGVGSDFSLRLRASTEPVPASEERASGETDSGKQATELKGSILYVEDEPINVMLMEHFCSSHPGIRLTVAQSGVEAMRVACELQPDLVLLDINLPDMDGRAVLSALRSDSATMRIPIVALSADVSLRHEHVPGGKGFDAHWVKPVDLGRLEIDLAKLLRPRGD